MDDFLLVGLKEERLRVLKLQLSEAFNIKDLGPYQFFLGVRITRDRSQDRTTIC
jgi:hypothetical protein